MPGEDIARLKQQARKAALARRKAAQAAGGDAEANSHLLEFLAPLAGRPVAGYMPIRSEISPLPAMARLSRHGPVGVPVIPGAGRPLAFHRWHPGAAMKPGPFGADVPVEGEEIVPRVLIVPLVAYDAAGYRLGYGGGFYDRTLEKLRRAGPVLAVGLAYAAQQSDGPLPVEPTDQRLDAVVTEKGVHRFG